MNQSMTRFAMTMGWRGFLLVAIVGVTSSAWARPDRAASRPLPASLEQLRLAAPVFGQRVDAATLDQSLAGASGSQQVIVRLVTQSVGQLEDKRPLARMGHASALEDEQQKFIERIQKIAPSAKVLARTKLVLNAVFLEVNALELAVVAKDPAVQRVTPVGNYRVDLTDSVPYIGAAALQAAGVDGTGVRVAVIDSGVDYTHFDLLGSGDPADFANNDPTLIEPGTFPTAKVVGGFDFIGSQWPSGSLAPDPDPLDDGPGGGHGTHVAHIIGGRNSVAPGVALYAFKVCSSVGTSCSGVALMQAMEAAVDPDGDGDPADHVDVINMSLGSDYGQAFDDDLSVAVDNATALGVLTVAASGNGGDKPFITSTPAAARTAISVAQTEMPLAFLPFMQVLQPVDRAGNYPAIFQPWSTPLTAIAEGPVQYGNGAGGNLNGCAVFTPGSLAGKIVFVNRGVCTFTAKIRNIQDAGGILGIIGLVAPGEPFAGAFGGGTPITIPGYMISQANGNILRTGAAVVRFDPANSLPLVRTMVGTSSRGPRCDDEHIKPEIGAPGASVSAVAGTGTGEASFGGTSGATPMVTGSAALVIQAVRARAGHDEGPTPALVKTLLMNNALDNIKNAALAGLASITRIGSGEVRVDRAVDAPAVAWNETDGDAALSFGFVDVANEVVVLHRRVKVQNFSGKHIMYDVQSSFRFPDDATTGAVVLKMPSKVFVGRGGAASFEVVMMIRGSLLRNNLMNSGSQGGNPGALTTNEYDGFVTLDDGTHAIHLPWHVLPRKAARIEPHHKKLHFASSGEDVVHMVNVGVGTAQNDAYTLLALSPKLTPGAAGQGEPTPDIRAVGVSTFPVPAGFCAEEPSFVWAFAVNTWRRQTHLLPVSHQIWLDIDQDGTDDFVVLNRDFSVLSSGALNSIGDGRQLSIAFDLANGTISAFFFAEHATNTANTVLMVCAEQVGLTAADMLTRNVNAAVVAQDFYFGGPGDLVGDITITPLGEQYVATAIADIESHRPGELTVTDFGPMPGSSPELGVLLYTNGDRGTASRGGATRKSEAVLLTVRGVEVTTGEPEVIATHDGDGNGDQG